MEGEQTRRCLRWVALCVLAACLAGCTAYVARRIEVPGRHAGQMWATMDTLLRKAHFQHGFLEVSPGWRLSYWHAWPYNYGAQVVVHGEHDEHHFSYQFQMDFVRSFDQAVALPARGSVVLLHPWGEQAETMSQWGLLFASAGFVVVMPDLRSQGDSSDALVGYGPREAGDMVRLLTVLRRRGQLPAPVYLLGHSYGATVALFTAARMPKVRGVVALAPYADATDVIRRVPDSGMFRVGASPSWLGRWLTSLVTGWLTPARMTRAIARASDELGVNLEQLDAGAVVARARACEVIVHGSRDRLTSANALRQLSRRSPRAAYVSVHGLSHIGLLLRTDWLFPPILAWMGAVPAAGTGTCPVLNVPANDPLTTGAHG